MMFNNLSKENKGALLMVLGIVLLFQWFGLFKAFFEAIFLVSGLALLGYGFFVGDFWSIVKKLLEKPQDPKNTP
jgi:uncharacterized membrane protein YkgB